MRSTDSGDLENDDMADLSMIQRRPINRTVEFADIHMSPRDSHMRKKPTKCQKCRKEEAHFVCRGCERQIRNDAKCWEPNAERCWDCIAPRRFNQTQSDVDMQSKSGEYQDGQIQKKSGWRDWRIFRIEGHEESKENTRKTRAASKWPWSYGCDDDHIDDVEKVTKLRTRMLRPFYVHPKAYYSAGRQRLYFSVALNPWLSGGATFLRARFMHVTLAYVFGNNRFTEEIAAKATELFQCMLDAWKEPPWILSLIRRRTWRGSWNWSIQEDCEYMLNGMVGILRWLATNDGASIETPDVHVTWY